MNTSLISHRMFVAALMHDGHVSDKKATSSFRADVASAARDRTARAPAKKLAALATRSWGQWRLAAWEEHSAS
jgi:hypothetical protein